MIIHIFGSTPDAPDLIESLDTPDFAGSPR